jgi:hypothetical protein
MFLCSPPHQVIMDAYGTMVALGFEYLVCSSFPNKVCFGQNSPQVKTNIIFLGVNFKDGPTTKRHVGQTSPHGLERSDVPPDPHRNGRVTALDIGPILTVTDRRVMMVHAP